MIRIIHRCMSESELTEKDWNGHFAFMHFKEFKNAKEVYLNGRPLKWWNRFKNGDVIEIVNRPAEFFSLVLIGMIVAHPIIAGVIAGAVIGGIVAGLSLAMSASKPTTQNREYSSSTNPELKGASNEISDDIIPVVFGRTQQTPSYGQTPYRLVYDGSGENKYRMYFVPNYSNVVYSDFKLGETAITNYLNQYYSINTASGSNTFIGFENCKAVNVDEELSYDKAGDVTQSYINTLNQTVSASSTTVDFVLRFENMPATAWFSSKSFDITLQGLNGQQNVLLTNNITVNSLNITPSGVNYKYTGQVTFIQSLTQINSITITPSAPTRNNTQETNSQLNVYVESETVTAGSYTDTKTPDEPINNYTGISSEILQTSPENTKEIDIILSFQQGLYKMTDKGVRVNRTQTVEIKYKKSTSNTWRNLDTANALYIRDLDGVKQPLSTSDTTVSGASVTVSGPKDMNIADQLFFRTIGFEVPVGQYDIRIRSAEYSDKSNYDVGYPTCAEIQFRCTGDVVNPLVLPQCNQVAFEVKAYKSLSGTLKKFNYIAQAIIPIWNGTDWNTTAATSNPAAIVRYLLTNKAVNPRAESLNHLDNDSLVEYYEWCESSGYKADGIIAEACKIGEIVNEILKNSQCAMIPLYNGKHTFVIDKPNKIPVGLFNMHNSWNFKWTPSVGRQTEAIRASFVENDDWTQDELTLYWYNGGVHDTPEAGKSDLDYEMVKKEYKYVCDRASVRRIVAYELETIQTKRNQFEFDVNLEAMNMMLLDRVYISNTANMQNESTGLIKSVITNNGNLTGFELYSDIDIPENAKIVIRSLDYINQKAIIKIYDVINSGLSYIVNINPVPYDGIVRGAGDITGLQDTWYYDGDLFTLGQDTIYDCTVTDIKYNENGTATITARDYGF